MTSYPWSAVREKFRGHKRGLQLVENCVRAGFPPPQSMSRGEPGECRVDWFDAQGYRMHLDTSMTCFGFEERARDANAR